VLPLLSMALMAENMMRYPTWSWQEPWRLCVLPASQWRGYREPAEAPPPATGTWGDHPSLPDVVTLAAAGRRAGDCLQERSGCWKPTPAMTWPWPASAGRCRLRIRPNPWTARGA
jgi:hypothetical protein